MPIGWATSYQQTTDVTVSPNMVFAKKISGGAGAVHLMLHKAGDANDDGTVITSRYRTGFMDFGDDREKTLREMQMWGTGTVATAVSKDFATAAGTATNVTLGASPAIDRAIYSQAKSGTLFSFNFASVSGGAWTLHRAEPRFREWREPGSRSSQ